VADHPHPRRVGRGGLRRRFGQLAVLENGQQLRRERRKLVGEERLVGRALDLVVTPPDADLRFDGAMMPRRMPSPPVGADAPEPPRHARLRWLWLRARLRGRLRVEGRATVAARVRIAVAPGASVTLGDGVELGEGVRIEAIAGPVRIGAGTRLGERCTLAATAGVEIGAGCSIGDLVLFADADPGIEDVETPVRLQPLRTTPIRIGDCVRIGAHAAILAGARVQDGAVVGSYAVVRSAYSSSALAE
jgi:acetyltransferase-like isoleucine patch superfamily enzyme